MNHRAVQQIARDTIAYIKTQITPGMPLRRVRELCEAHMLGLGADSFWYYDIGAFVFSGDETAVSVSGREYVTSDRVIGENDIVTIDLSPQCAGIWGDFARTVILENGHVVNGTDAVQNAEWRAGLQMEALLHRELLAFAAPETTFEALYLHMNRLISEAGFVNLDFLHNLGHSIVREKADRIYIAQGNQAPLSSVRYFTFEPHISVPDSKYGYKTENIYGFSGGRLAEL